MNSRTIFNKLPFIFVLGLLLVIFTPVVYSAGQYPLSDANLNTITVSGTVTGPDGPVADAWVGINSPPNFEETTTDGAGFYSLSIETDGRLWFHIRPDTVTRLTQVNSHKVGAAGNVTQDFTVTEGNLLTLQVTGDGSSISGNFGFEIVPLVEELTGGQWYALDWDEEVQQYHAVMHPDVYYISATKPPAGYYNTVHSFDLSLGDQNDSFPLNTDYEHPIPYEPPDASKISFGPVEDLGEVTITGAPGAAMPLAHVLLVNLNSSHQGHAISDANGAFYGRLFAPPGSSILIKHGPPGHRWHDLDMGVAEGLNPYPGTIINRPHTHTATGSGEPFASAGAIGLVADDKAETLNFVGAAWMLTGEMGPVVEAAWSSDRGNTGNEYEPGDDFRLQATLKITGQAITATTDVSAIQVFGALDMIMLSNEQGNPLPVQSLFMSPLTTTTGFPIQGGPLTMIPMDTFINVTNLQYAGEQTITGAFDVTGQIPLDSKPGFYRPVIRLDYLNVPTSDTWTAANVTRFGLHHGDALLAPIRIGAAASPKLVWGLLTDNIVQGNRGTFTEEDSWKLPLTSQIVTQGAPYYTPPKDARSGQPIEYRLEPHIPRISFTDRRMPFPPLIPFELPGGELCVEIEKPQGSPIDLGCEPLAQSFNRTATTRGGFDLNVGTTQLNDIYSLKAASDRFRVTFDQYGRYVVHMGGTLNDIWGNAYYGGGAYEFWVAEPLDIDPGVLPGTPLAAGEAFNPAMQFYPRVPADVSLTISHYPDSDPAQKETHTVTGQGNRFGYFSGSGSPITLMDPGEFRVDLVVSYQGDDGVLYMGTMTWGGVVMTPENQADLIAHGRRGVDTLSNIPNAWFVSCRDLAIPAGAVTHTLNPYFNGDMVWSRMPDNPGECPEGISTGGDALILGASVQDKVGTIEAAVLDRANRMKIEMAPPGNLSERFSKDEIPLFISTESGKPPQVVPSDIDQMAYSYRFSQRPGVRVREMVAQDNESGGYWRLDTLYDDQLGDGLLGDQANDFKFQYVGGVYQDLDTGDREYVGQGTGWIFIPSDDPKGTRVMPPFEGLPDSGPLLKLKGEDVQIFIFPTGTSPGAILEVGDSFRFAGHLMPTLNSQVAVTVTAPSGGLHHVTGQANKVGYFYNPSDDFVVGEAGLWMVDVKVWHDGSYSIGTTTPPFPSGDVLGGESGRYYFYVVPAESSQLPLITPTPGFLTIRSWVKPITIRGLIPFGLSNATVDYTISMPGFILEHGQADVSGGQFTFNYDPASLHEQYPNLDLIGREFPLPGLADTIAIGMLMKGQDGGQTVYQANTIILQGEQVFVDNALPEGWTQLYLPAVQKGAE